MAQQDIFLKISTDAAGPLKGESTDPDHVGDISIIGWHWGMKSPRDAHTFQATGKTQIQPITVRKYADTASTGLMSALRRNDGIKKATLAVRKASGTKPVDYFVINLEKGRLLSYDVQSERDEKGAPVLLETIEIGFTRITIEYKAQEAKGGGLATSTFQDEIAAPG
ncbi:MAG: type VI secretion system tube protein Hcp [Mycobacteriaceae bacterium]|nr:type VI secretion system tube protein Hcp [Mycobacteriaceae bacterium]